MTDTTAKPRRWYLQFSLRTLLLLMLLFAVVLGWKLNQARKQQAAVDCVRLQGGSVFYDYEVDENGKPRKVAVPPAPSWLIRLAGIDFVADVVSVNLRNSKVEDLRPLQGMPRTERLYLRRTPVSDLSPLAGLSRLQTLELASTRVTDLSPLAALRNLQWLDIDHTRVSDLAPLAEGRCLQRFYCAHTLVSDISPLAGHTGMLRMNLTGTPLEDISPLASLKNLEVLELRATAVNDLSPLTGLQALHHLDMFGTPATDLSPLAGKGKLSVELGGHPLQQFETVAGLESVGIVLYKRPRASVPRALEPYLEQIRISTIYEEYRPVPRRQP